LQQTRLQTVAEHLAVLLHGKSVLTADDIHTWDGALAPGYGQMNDASEVAIRTAARLEGMFLDPVYTAKSFAALKGLLREGVLKPGMKVIYLHTGGLPALFGYEEKLATI